MGTVVTRSSEIRHYLDMHLPFDIICFIFNASLISAKCDRTLRHLNEDYGDDNNSNDDDDDETGPFGFYFKLLLKYVFLNVNTVHGNK